MKSLIGQAVILSAVAATAGAQPPAGDEPSGIFQRGGGLVPTALAVDSSGNGVFDPGETVNVAPSWQNLTGAQQAFGGAGTTFTGPGSPGNPIYSIVDAGADYGSVANGATSSCASIGDCYQLAISTPSTRPAQHWDATFHEDITPPILAESHDWILHVGGSFSDVSATSGFYRFIEAMLHHGVTSGCTATQYCPALATSREQMAVFALVAKEGAGFVPVACGATPMFADVPASNPFCRWIEELARRGVVAGCGGGNYCPRLSVTRDQMAVFALRTLDPTLQPPACTTPIYPDVPASNGFCRWIEELTRRGVVTGCGGGLYCPGLVVTRDQMGVFISATFGLTLYGP